MHSPPGLRTWSAHHRQRGGKPAADLHARAVRFGRRTEVIKVLPGIVPCVADTRPEAEDCRAQLETLAHSKAGLSTLSHCLGVDLSQYPLDEMLLDIDVQGMQGHYKEVANLTRRSGIPLRELGRRYGAARTATGFTGSGSDIADTMENWLTAGACDGIMIQVPDLPGGLEDLVRLATPESQRRSLFRAGTTPRDHLGLTRPAA